MPAPYDLACGISGHEERVALGDGVFAQAEAYPFQSGYGLVGVEYLYLVDQIGSVLPCEHSILYVCFRRSSRCYLPAFVVDKIPHARIFGDLLYGVGCRIVVGVAVDYGEAVVAGLIHEVAVGGLAIGVDKQIVRGLAGTLAFVPFCQFAAESCEVGLRIQHE